MISKEWYNHTTELTQITKTEKTMKKVLLLMAALMVVTFSAQAQKKTKAEKEADKARKELATAALMDRIIPAKNFQFVPFEYTQSNSGTQNINRYEYTKVRPNSLESAMTGTPGINTNRYEWVLCEKKKDIWQVKIKAVADGGANVTYTFAINAKSGMATLRIASNKASSLTYKGSVREH